MTIHFQFTPEDHASWSDWYMTHSKESKLLIRRATVVWSLVLAAICTLAALWTHSSYAWIFALEALIGIGFFVFLFPKRFRSQMRNRTLKTAADPANKKLYGARTLEINDEGLISISEQATTLFKWSALHQIVTTEDHAYLVIGTNQAVIIPRSRIEEGNFDAFVAEAQRLHRLATGEKVALPLAANS